MLAALAKLGVSSFSLNHRWRLLFPFCFQAFEPLGAQIPLNYFVFMINKSSFFKFVFLYNLQKKKKNWVEHGRDLLLRSKMWVNWNQENLFLEYFFWISAVAKEYKRNCMFLKIPWRLEGVKPEVQSIGIRECFIFIYVKFFVRKVGCN